MPVSLLGQNDDILWFAGTSWGANPSGTFTLGFDGNAFGLAAVDVDAIEIL